MIGALNLYVVVHTHNYGSSIYQIRSKSLPDQDRVVRALDIDIDPERDESIEIHLVDSQGCPTLDEIEAEMAK